MSIDRKTVIANEHKVIFAKPIVTANPTFDVAQIEDFFTLFNLYADNRRQADVREIVSTAKTLGYEKSHEFIYKALVAIADSLEGEWVDFETFLTLLTETIVRHSLCRDTPIPRRAGGRPSSSSSSRARNASLSTTSRNWETC
jgi:hypothetical protein